MEDKEFVKMERLTLTLKREYIGADCRMYEIDKPINVRMIKLPGHDLCIDDLRELMEHMDSYVMEVLCTPLTDEHVPKGYSGTIKEESRKVINDLKARQAAGDTISRCELFNRLATVQTLADAYAVIQGMPAASQPELIAQGAYARGFEQGRTQGMIDAKSQQKEIIRCKQCAHWLPHCQLGFDEDNGEYHDYCGKLIPEDEYYAFYRNADDYCSRAERRADDREEARFDD